MIVQGAEIAADAVVDNLITIEEGTVLLEFRTGPIEIWCDGKRVASIEADDAEAVRDLLDSWLNL